MLRAQKSPQRHFRRSIALHALECGAAFTVSDQEGCKCVVDGQHRGSAARKDLRFRAQLSDAGFMVPYCAQVRSKSGELALGEVDSSRFEQQREVSVVDRVSVQEMLAHGVISRVVRRLGKALRHPPDISVAVAHPALPIAIRHVCDVRYEGGTMRERLLHRLVGI
jgi:hypothetical protein